MFLDYPPNAPIQIIGKLKKITIFMLENCKKSLFLCWKNVKNLCFNVGKL